jgi:demethylmenaquinone methyltransferase/2-methoxy-6-polyprenyl-1,4-benzoquinol methylase
MFSAIAGSYDFLNRLFSLGTDVRWRRELASEIPPDSQEPILDLATGTGDVALALEKQIKGKRLIVGADFTLQMLRVAAAKILRKKADGIRLAVGDALDLPFRENIFSAVSIAFGLRNLSSRLNGLVEMTRVLRPGGVVLVLEFSRMDKSALGPLFRIYFHRVIPFLGGIISGNPGAYRYLPASVDAFPDPVQLAHEMIEAGLVNVKYRPLTFGIAYLHVGEKRQTEGGGDTETRGKQPKDQCPRAKEN